MNADLNELHSEMRPRVDAWLADCAVEGIVVMVYCTLRSGFNQALLYAIGRTTVGKDPTPLRPMGKIVTNAKAGESPHQYGLAIDYVVIVHGKADWSGTGLVWDRVIALAAGRGLTSLRPFESDHLQHDDWKKLAGVK